MKDGDRIVAMEVPGRNDPVAVLSLEDGGWLVAVELDDEECFGCGDPSGFVLTREEACAMADCLRSFADEAMVDEPGQVWVSGPQGVENN